MREQLTSDMTSWDIRKLAAVFLFSVVVQGLSLPCLCDAGTAKANFAGVLDFFVAVRIAWAYLAREHSDAGAFYAWLLLLSPAWITALSYWINGAV